MKSANSYLGGIDEITTSSTCNTQKEKSRTTGQRFTIVDLDPFGSPASYVDCVMRSVEDGGLISVNCYGHGCVMWQIS